MAPGAVEEAGEVGKSIIEKLGAQPLVLSLALMNIGLLAFIFWNQHELMTMRDRTAQLVVSWQTDVAKLLANCVPIRDMQEFLRDLQGRDKQGKLPEKPKEPPVDVPFQKSSVENLSLKLRTLRGAQHPEGAEDNPAPAPAVKAEPLPDITENPQ